MKFLRESSIRKFLMEERGQALPVIMFGLTAFLGFAGVSIEVGHGYYAAQMLQASTNAAALAGAAGLPNQTTATTYATNYSSISTDENANGIMTVQSTGLVTGFYCSSTVSGWGTPCQDNNGNYTSSGANVMTVTQTAKVPTWLAGMFGVANFNISTKATAAMAGGQYTPDNIAIVVDTTASMAANDPGTQTACSNKSQIACALLGAQKLLTQLNPCSSGTTCTTGSKPVNTVSLFVFPSVLGTTASKDYTCPTSNPTIEPYTFQNTTAAAPNFNPPATYAYQITNWATDYRTSVGATLLNPSSDIVIAVGDSGVGGCPGVSAPGGYGTYYAQAIYTAQAALIAEQTAEPGSSNVMIILSDGDATACAANGNTAAGACNTKADLVVQTGYLNGTIAASPGNCTAAHNCSPTSYTYPSAVGECGQAVVAAQAAAAAGTKVETIGYGSETSGCTTDATYSATVSSTTYAGTGWGATGAWKAGDSPCQALAAMAAGLQFFYSDDGNGCVSPDNGSITQLNQIFGAITNGLSSPRLLPNGTA
jgi:Flp pilus assembly protein TadG